VKRFLPVLLLVAGMAFLGGAFVYRVLFAGIPYQDPTPEMTANYDRHARIAGGLALIGATTLLAGAVTGWARLRSKQVQPAAHRA
jgi:hypothetical protein